MPEIADVIAGETIAVDWGNDIRDRSVNRYVDASDRTALNPTPTAGELSFRADAGVIEVFAGGVWRSPIPAASTSAAGQVQLSSSTSSTSETIAATSLAAKTAWDKGNHAHPYAPTHSHPYSSSTHDHSGDALGAGGGGSVDSISVDNATVGNLQVNADLTAVGTTTINSAVIGNILNSGFISTGDLRPDALWPYNNVNGSIRWMGTNAAVGQSHTSSSVEVKRQVSPVDVEGAVFSRLDPVWFRYRESHPHKARFGDSWAAENPPMGRMGFTFEQVSEVAPQWAYVADGMKAVSYEGMLPDFIAWATAAIRDLSVRVNMLEGKEA